MIAPTDTMMEMAVARYEQAQQRSCELRQEEYAARDAVDNLRQLREVRKELAEARKRLDSGEALRAVYVAAVAVHGTPAQLEWLREHLAKLPPVDR